MTDALALRAGRDDDAAGYIDLISACWAEYPGCVFDLDGEVPELRALATYFAAKHGALWTAEHNGRVVGMVGVAPTDGAAWKLTRMYVAGDHRGIGIAQSLLATAEAHARALGAAEMELWSDTRFDRAHRFYEKSSYVRTGPIVALDDRSNSIEFAFAKPLSGIGARTLNASGATSARTRLALVLRECVDAGASVSFLAPLGADEAAAYWHRIASDVAQGRRILIAAWLDGVLVGTVQLDLATPANQSHRAVVKKLLVAPSARRRGVARALLEAADTAAISVDRWLLTLDTRANDAGDALYRALGWREAGRIPGYTLDVEGAAYPAVLFYKMFDKSSLTRMV